MQLEQEELIAEILGTSPTGDYCHWPRTAASPPGLLDVACGSGHLAVSAAGPGVDATGVDLACNVVERASEPHDTRSTNNGLNKIIQTT